MSQHALERLTANFPEAVLETHAFRGDDVALIVPEKLKAVCELLKTDEELAFDMLTSVTCVDRLLLPDAKPRFELVYHFLSLSKNKRVRLKARLDEGEGGKAPEIDSLFSLWKTADYWERMVWDMYGVKFRGHPNLKRLYMYEEFKGHALRKDYPLRGRQPLIEERDFRDLVRGPGANTPRS